EAELAGPDVAAVGAAHVGVGDRAALAAGGAVGRVGVQVGLAAVALVAVAVAPTRVAGAARARAGDATDAGVNGGTRLATTAAVARVAQRVYAPGITALLAHRAARVVPAPGGARG